MALPRHLRRLQIASAILLALLVSIFYYFQVQVKKREAKTAENLPRYGAVGDFTLADSTGKPFNASALAGKIWVAQFFFTDCGGPCPAVTAKLIELQGMLGDARDVRLVGISIDPDNDTPAKLRDYLALHHADPARWILLTGNGLSTPGASEAAIHDLVATRFLIGYQKNTAADATAATRVVHSTKIALIDATGTVRGYYEGLDDETPKQLLSDIASLMREEKLH